MSVEELRAYGVERMDDDAIHDFLASQGVGVLGLSAGDVPYLLPMSFGYDGDSRLYFTFVLGQTSRKADLSEQADRARFLVYTADSSFNWETVLLRGTIDELPESSWADAEGALANGWTPDIFESADLSGGVSIYEFQIEEQTGLKQAGLPPSFRE